MVDFPFNFSQSHRRAKAISRFAKVVGDSSLPEVLSLLIFLQFLNATVVLS